MLSQGLLSRTYKIGDSINLPFLNGKIELVDNRTIKSGDEYFLRFNNFDGVVASYNGRIKCSE